MNQPISNVLKEAQAKKRQLHEQATNAQVEFLRTVLISSTSMLGILIALHIQNEAPQYIRLAFVAALIALSVGVLTAASALWCVVKAHRDLRDRYIEEDALAAAEGRQAKTVTAGSDSLFQSLRIVACIFLVIGLLLITAYAILSTLYN